MHNTIELLITGGTIDKIYQPLSGEVGFEGSQIDAMLQQARVTLPIKKINLFLKDSLDITANDRKKILTHCFNSSENAIVITHGTDTLVDTAQLLDEQRLSKTIVLLGAMRPYSFGKSDALFNLGTAISAAQTLNGGVWVAMNGQVFRADSVVKNRKKGVFEAKLKDQRES